MADPKPNSPKASASKGEWRTHPDLLPTVPANYKSVGEVRVISINEAETVRVVADDVRVWKEATK